MDLIQVAKQREYLSNRLMKRFKHLRKWAKRENVSCFRVYDRDIPEIPLSIDWYDGYAHVYLWERPYEKDEAEEALWLEEMGKGTAETLGVERSRIFTKMRKRQKGDDQYEKLAERKVEIEVREGNCRFIVNLTDYLDTGLFLDHRITRAMVGDLSENAHVLNLFCYTGSFSVHALSGGAKSVDSVDISNTYLDWARRNCALNGFEEGDTCRFSRTDVREFLSAAARGRKRYDVVILDPPTFSNSKRAERDFDVNRDWMEMVGSVLAVLSPGGTLFFSTNSRRFKLDPGLLHDAGLTDITAQTTPPDFLEKHPHKTFLITHK